MSAVLESVVPPGSRSLTMESRLLRTDAECSDLIAEWPPHMLQDILSEGRTITLKDGEILSLEGRIEAVFLVLSGCLKGVMRIDEEHEHIVDLMRPGSILGLVAVFDSQAKLHDHVAQGLTSLFVVPKARFLDIYHRDAAFAMHIVQILCKRVRTSYSIVEDYATNARRRIARRLLRVAMEFGELDGDKAYVNFHLHQNEWAAMTGLSRQTTNKELGRLRREGVFNRRGEIWVIESVEALENIANDVRCIQTRSARQNRLSFV